MKIYNKWIIPFLPAILFTGLWSCDLEEIDDYKEFTKGGEISYTEKLDSVQVYSGRNRAMIEGIITADPKVSEYRVFWNSEEDSIVVPVERSAGVDTLNTIIEDLEENVYNFVIRTFDNEGNSSIPVNVTGEVFGERYQESLNNRPVVSNELIGTNLTVNFAGMDLSSGVIGTEIEYTNTEALDDMMFVPIDSSRAFIDNYLGGSQYEYRTVFLPEPTSIDTFYTGYKSFTPEMQISTPPYLKNASYPYEIGDNSGGRWNTPAEWIHNSPALSHNGYGALDGDLFDLESGWGQPAIVNGKIYQTVVLEPGTYAFIVDIRETNFEAIDAKDQVYFSVAEGSTLPDVGSVENSSATLAYQRVSRENLYNVIEFTITENTQVSLGVQGSLPDEGVGRYLKINSFALGQISEAPYLKNASVPFEAAERDGRWGNLADWTTNDAAKNHNGFGGWDEWNGNIFNLESGWGAPAIENGKVYQTLILEPGTYTYEQNFRMVDGSINTNHAETDEGAAYFVVAKGSNLPNVSNIETSSNTLGYERILQGKDPENFEITFTLEEITQVSVGFATTQADGSPGRFANITSFEFYKE